MKNPIIEVIEKGEREFREKANYLFRNPLIRYGQENGFKNPHISADKDIQEFISHLHQSQLALLQAVVEGMKKEKVKYENENDYYMNGVKGDIKNVILTDQISSLTTIIKELDNKK